MWEWGYGMEIGTRRGVIWECGYGSRGCLEVSGNANSTVYLSLVLPVQVRSGYGGRCTPLWWGHNSGGGNTPNSSAAWTQDYYIIQVRAHTHIHTYTHTHTHTHTQIILLHASKIPCTPISIHLTSSVEVDNILLSCRELLMKCSSHRSTRYVSNQICYYSNQIITIATELMTISVVYKNQGMFLWSGGGVNGVVSFENI